MRDIQARSVGGCGMQMSDSPVRVWYANEVYANESYTDGPALYVSQPMSARPAHHMEMSRMQMRQHHPAVPEGGAWGGHWPIGGLRGRGSLLLPLPGRRAGRWRAWPRSGLCSLMTSSPPDAAAGTVPSPPQPVN